ncbi:hypothetical protein Tco_0784264 [Tanacetum coccineum]
MNDTYRTKLQTSSLTQVTTIQPTLLIRPNTKSSCFSLLPRRQHPDLYSPADLSSLHGLKRPVWPGSGDLAYSCSPMTLLLADASSRALDSPCRARSSWAHQETATYGKIWYDEDVLDPRSVESEFPAIVFNDSLTLNETPSCEPMVSSLNDDIDFRISFDESDDEDYTNEFPAIVYNDALTSKLDLLTEPTISPRHIDEFDLKDETSLSECDEEE